MLALGYNKPIICTEYGGPAFFQFPENRKYFSLLSSWMQSVAQGSPDGAALQDKAGGNQIAELYQRMSSLAPETQMFMLGCAPELEAKYDRIQARGLVMRNLFAFAAGVQKTLYWQLLDLRTNRDNMIDSPAVPFDCAWAEKKAIAVDALGQTVPVHIAGGRLHLEISLTPVFLEPVR